MISSIVYSGDGTTRIFPVDFKILGENFVRVYVDDVEIVDKRKYDIINNSIVFNEEETPQIGEDNVVIIVATSESELGDLDAPITDIMIVAQNIANINSVVQQVVPNLAEILQADDNASTATQKALEASNSATSANGAAITATTQAGIATTKAGEANTSAISANASATIATTQAGIATTKAGEASASAISASTSAGQALTSRNQAQTFAQQASASATSVDANNIVHRTGDEEIGGVKTFSSSPIVPTPIAGDASTKVASTAFVNSEVGVSNSPLVKTALNATGNAPIYACRAWVNFNGTGTVSIRASGNVSSITDNGTGNYTVNFITAMSDAEYSATYGSSRDSTVGIYYYEGTVNSINCLAFNSSGGIGDESTVSIVISR